MPGDATSADLGKALPPYVAFQGDGDVTADVVYVNYGLPADYLALDRRGISVKGKIVLARYGSGWRGLKPKLAQEHGAVGCIIYSDPADDGYGQGDPYPKGGARPPQSVQRGSVADMTTFPGDPLTPGIGAVPGATRLARADAPTILKIPVLPMSYADATQILGSLGGPFAPDAWRGALPLAYHIGGDGKTTVHLAVKSDWALRPLYDVIATLRGAKYPDEWVVRGNHHDGWVFGAADPLSGNVAMLAEAKALGALAKSGWRPARTIVYASWDGEEPMLLGSTEWAETHAAELKAKAVIYINTDGNGRGFLGVQGSHSWQHLVNAVAADVTDPQTGVSVAKRLRGGILANAYDKLGHTDETALAAAEAGGDVPIGALGSGSDYSSFLQHLGIASLNIGYGGESESGGVYHSAYDSFDHFTKFDDPGLAYGATLSKTVGRLVLRIADAETPPVRFGDFADNRRALPDRSEEACRGTPHAGWQARGAARGQGVRAGHRPAQSGRRAGGRSADAILRIREAGGCGGASRGRRQGLRRRLCQPRGRPRPRRTRALERRVARHRPVAPRPARPAGEVVVPEPRLCAGPFHRLRRQDAAWRPRSDRGTPFRRCRRLCGLHRCCARPLCGQARSGDRDRRQVMRRGRARRK